MHDKVSCSMMLFTSGILLVSACGVGLGLVIGSFLLSVLLFIIRRSEFIVAAVTIV